MESIWLLLVTYDFLPVGRRFLVDVDMACMVCDMADKVGEKRQKDLLVDPASLTVWRMRGSTVIDHSTPPSSLPDMLKRIRTTKNTIEEVYVHWRLADLGLRISEGETLLLQMPEMLPNNPGVDDEASGGSGDVVPELKEFKRYNKTFKAGTREVAPSEGAKSTEYRRIQGNTEAIYDGRRAPDGHISTIGPPIYIFHPIFNDFIRSINNLDVQPTINDLTKVREFMHFAATVGRSEDNHGEHLRGFLRSILDADVHEEPNPDKSCSDGVLTVQKGDTRIAYFIMEVKRDIGEGGCDPTTQVALSMRHSWVQQMRDSIREKCCCPTILVAGGGPWLVVMGGVFTDRVIVQRLTDMRWFAISSTEEDTRVYHNARVLVALRNCLTNLRAFYEKLDAPPLVSSIPHPRYFPYPNSFVTEDGSVTRFRYLEALEPDAACVTYLAEILNETGATEDPQKVVVKFVARYGEEVHKFLAQKGWAPTLRYCGPLPDVELCDVTPGPAQKAPPGLCLQSNLMHMVVMDYIHAQTKTPPNVRGQIQSVLSLLHSNGYVFGDLRKRNILFDDGKVKLIDFNWCGRYDMNIRDNNIPDDVQNKIDLYKDRVRVEENKNYVRYPLAISNIPGMWVSGVLPLKPIRPEHDWRMFDELSWDASA